MIPIIAIPESETKCMLKVLPFTNSIHWSTLKIPHKLLRIKKRGGERKIKSSSCLGVFNLDMDLQAEANCLMFHPPLWYTEYKCSFCFAYHDSKI